MGKDGLDLQSAQDKKVKTEQAGFKSEEWDGALD